jgi:hypothetical protein
MRLDLNASYFKTKIIEASALGKLWVMILKNTVFKVEKSGSSSSAMALLDFKKENYHKI